MNFRTYAAAFAAAVVLMLPAAASAQTAKPSLPIGTWTGTVTPPNGETAPITLDVKSSNDTIAITINAGPHGSFQVNEVALADSKLTFWFTPGPRVDCVLNKKDDGSYEGQCTEGDGSAALITMVPPKKADS